MDSLVVRFSETEYYNINHDEGWVRFMGITGKGSYYSELPRGTGKDLRENRAKFKEMTLEAMRNGENPKEINLEDTLRFRVMQSRSSSGIQGIPEGEVAEDSA